MWIERFYSRVICNAIKQFPSVLLSGPRHTGKTSLLKKLFPDYNYITLDIPSVAEQAEKNPELFLTTLKTPVIIDEIQYAPSIFRYLKYYIDKFDQNGRYLLTGSQDFQLMQNVSDSLAGRCAILNLHTLSVSEILNHNKTDEFEIMLRGGYPELWAQQVINTSLWYSSYISTYLERDVRNLLNVGSLREFERFLRSVSTRTGQLLCYSEISRDIGIAVSTVREWISVLNASKQIFILEPYYKNLGKRIVKTPKVYIADIGLALFLNGIKTKEQLLNSRILGPLWETFVIGEIYRMYMINGLKPNIWFWKNQSGKEVDLLIDIGGCYYIYEIKFAEVIDKKDMKGFDAFKNMYGKNNIIQAGIICRTRKEFSYSDDIQILNIMNGTNFLSSIL